MTSDLTILTMGLKMLTVNLVCHEIAIPKYEVSDRFYESASFNLFNRQDEFALKMFQSLFDKLVQKIKETPL